MQILIKLLADGAIVPVVLLAGYAFLFRVPKGRRPEVYSRILMAGLTSYLVAKLMGSVYQPALERPFEILGQAAGASYLNNPGFPSDHALFTVFLTLAVLLGVRWRTGALIMAIFTVLVCIGRVLALVHTPLDIIGGIVTASLGSLWYLHGFTMTTTRKSRKKRVQ
ncbi:MAG TPA: phosphatase PAP2 family protein [Candidatus Saccharimonadales bacterium]|nr:phosphatase PAP2 family protein [Candidatus Saccharimonadales bacterium]